MKRYLDLLGGTITFTSEPGNTVFHVEVPLIAITPKTEPQTI
ncbi:MAG: ATP-binding protein [Flavobacteriales bacterium]|nr:ATP-binding protein [Flavobacteriales bacterium]